MPRLRLRRPFLLVGRVIVITPSLLTLRVTRVMTLPLRSRRTLTTFAPSGAKTTMLKPRLRTVFSEYRLFSVSASSLSFGATGATTGRGAGATAGAPIEYPNDATLLVLPAASIATALIVCELGTLSAFEYAALDAVGSDPSVV